MSARSFWLDLFTSKTWIEFLDAGGTVSGFREGRRATVEKLKPGDYLLCYLVRVSRFIGVLEVVSEPFYALDPIWNMDVFPCRVHVKPIITLEPENAVPIAQLKDQLSFFDPERPLAWTGHVRGSPAKWLESDGEVILRALQQRNEHPQPTPIPQPPDVPAPVSAREIGAVIVPGHDESVETATEPSLHTEIQWSLLSLGNNMGLDVWAARNDRGRQIDGHALTELPHMRRDLPLQFDEATTRTIELIDVLWLRGNAIVAAFEIECTTSVYSGLLRMSDLISMQPNLRIPLYIVAPDERRSKVITEINRPTFSHLKPPMSEICKYISIRTLRDQLVKATPFVRHLRPEFIDEFAESCELEDV